MSGRSWKMGPNAEIKCGKPLVGSVVFLDKYKFDNECFSPNEMGKSN